MSNRTRPRGAGLAFWGAVAGTSLLSLVGLNIAADKIGGGAATLRDYVVRRNG